MPLRVLIIGSPCSGKSTLRDRLSAFLKLPSCSMDDLYWEPGWRRPNYSVFRRRLDDFIYQDDWLLDGNYFESLSFRLNAATHIIYLRYPVHVTMWRYLKRACQRYILGKREKHAIALWRPTFIVSGVIFSVRKILLFPLRFDRKINSLLVKSAIEGKKVVILNHPSELDNVVNIFRSTQT